MKSRMLPGALLALTLLGCGATNEGKRWWSHVEYLASDQLQGRATGSEGHRKAAEYVAENFRKAGLQPAGVNGGWLQPVPLVTRHLVQKESSIALVGKNGVQPLAIGPEALINVQLDPTGSIEAPLAFAGYGLTIPELKYDDLARVDLRGKVAVCLMGGPSNVPGPLSSHYQSSAEKAKFFRRAGALGVINIPNPKHLEIPWERIARSVSLPSMDVADPELDENQGMRFAAGINPAHAEKLFAGSGHSFAEVLKLAGEGKPLPVFPLPLSVKAKIKVERSMGESQNVAGILPGTDPELKNQYVVLSAHLDHLGVGEPVNGDRIYNGAMDDASGVASLLEIAESLHKSKTALRRSLLFVAVTGEDKGLLGSKYFAAHPTVNRKAMVADINMDMYLPIVPLRMITVYGLNESDLGADIRAVAESRGVRIQDDPEPERNLFIRSDQYNFIRKGIPALFFKVGYDKGSREEQIAKQWLKERYHAPSDDARQPVDLECAAAYNRIMQALAERVANRAAPPEWNAGSFFRRFAD